MRFQHIRNWAAIYLWPVLATEEWTWEIIICLVIQWAVSLDWARTVLVPPQRCSIAAISNLFAIIWQHWPQMSARSIKEHGQKTNPCFITATCTRSRCSHSWLLVGINEPMQEQNFCPYGGQNQLDTFPIPNSKHFYQCWIKGIWCGNVHLSPSFLSECCRDLNPAAPAQRVQKNDKPGGPFVLSGFNT